MSEGLVLRKKKKEAPLISTLVEPTETMESLRKDIELIRNCVIQFIQAQIEYSAVLSDEAEDSFGRHNETNDRFVEIEARLEELEEITGIWV